MVASHCSLAIQTSLIRPGELADFWRSRARRRLTTHPKACTGVMPRYIHWSASLNGKDSPGASCSMRSRSGLFGGVKDSSLRIWNSISDAIGRDLAGSREAFHLLWGLLRQDSWLTAPALLDEVVRLGREHQVEVGSLLGQQVPGAVERLLQGALSHPANQAELAPFLTGTAARRELLEHLHAGALRCLYRILFVLYAEARGLLPLDMPALPGWLRLSGSRGLVRRTLIQPRIPARNPGRPGFF